MNPVKYLYKTLRLRTYSHQLKRRPKHERLGYTFTSTESKLGDFVKEQHRIHRWFKGVIAFPAIWLATKFLGKYLIDKPNPQYRQARVFDDAYEKSIVEVNELYRYNMPHYKELTLKELRENYANGIATKLLRSMKRIYLSVMLRDTFYLEFHNLLMHNIAKGMVDEYGKEPQHVMFAGEVLNAPIYWLFKGMKEGLVKAEVRKK